MTFTSNVFLIGFFPWFCIILYLLRKKSWSKKIMIFFADSIFYIWGGIGAFLFICVFSFGIWILAISVAKWRNKAVLFGSVCLGILPLVTIKYVGFFINNVNKFLGYGIRKPTLIVPIGISFFTFQAVSLLCDLFRGTVKGKISMMEVYLYLNFFPTVTSGPILRFKDFREGLIQKIDYTVYDSAIERIVTGLGKKVLLADKLAVLADYYFDGVAAGEVYSAAGLWLGAIAYSLQIYFDFSGYSDMAIGMGRMLGFEMNENFNRLYRADSVSDFWKRWHISLTRWFRDYIYIPLGGNRCNVSKHILNLLVVWLLTGVWHGADWSFIIWGVGYFILLVAEKYIPFMKNIGKHWWGHLYTLFFVNLLWIPFRANDLSTTGKYIAGMFRIKGPNIEIEGKAVSFIPFILFAMILCTPWDRVLARYFPGKYLKIIRGSAVIILAGVAVCAVMNAAYAPYIYGNF